MFNSVSVSRSDGSNRSGWARPMMLLASTFTEAAPLLRLGLVPPPLSDTPPVLHSREKCLFFHDFESLFYILGNFFNLSNLAQWSMTHVSVV